MHLTDELEAWTREQRAKLSRTHDLARAIGYMLRRWPAFTRLLENGWHCQAHRYCTACLAWAQPARPGPKVRRWLTTNMTDTSQQA